MLGLSGPSFSEDGARELAVSPDGTRTQEAVGRGKLWKHMQLEHRLEGGPVHVPFGEILVEGADGEQGAVLQARERGVGRSLRARECL